MRVRGILGTSSLVLAGVVTAAASIGGVFDTSSPEPASPAAAAAVSSSSSSTTTVAPAAQAAMVPTVGLVPAAPRPERQLRTAKPAPAPTLPDPTALLAGAAPRSVPVPVVVGPLGIPRSSSTRTARQSWRWRARNRMRPAVEPPGGNRQDRIRARRRRPDRRRGHHGDADPRSHPQRPPGRQRDHHRHRPRRTRRRPGARSGGGPDAVHPEYLGALRVRRQRRRRRRPEQRLRRDAVGRAVPVCGRIESERPVPADARGAPLQQLVDVHGERAVVVGRLPTGGTPAPAVPVAPAPPERSPDTEAVAEAAPTPAPSPTEPTTTRPHHPPSSRGDRPRPHATADRSGSAAAALPRLLPTAGTRADAGARRIVGAA